MQLVERHIISKNHSSFKEIDSIAFLSKNLYNKANYILRDTFITTSDLKTLGIVENAKWVRYNEIQKRLQNAKDVDYNALPAKVSQQVLKTLDKNWKSFFAIAKDYKKSPHKYEGRPKLPKYKHKTNGRNLLTYTIQSISKVELRQGIVALSKTDIRIKTKQTNINQVRIVPKNSCYIIEIIYTKNIKINENLDKRKIAGIDLGLNNLATVTSNQNSVKPLVINGRALKSMNQFYNKKRAKLQSFVGDKSSRKLRILTHKRNMKVDNYLHNASRIIVNHLVENCVGMLVIGKNKQWKTGINIGRKTNQNFVNIPHARFIEMLEYKCKLIGIEVKITEESYTSKCSFIDFEDICKHETYLGKRVKRGLFVSKDKTKINADCNGSGNIIRKAFPNAFVDGIEGVVVSPLIVNLSRSYDYKKVA